MAGRPKQGIIAERAPGVDGGHCNGWRQVPVFKGESVLSPEPVDNYVDSMGECAATRPLAAPGPALVIFCSYNFLLQKQSFMHVVMLPLVE